MRYVENALRLGQTAVLERSVEISPSGIAADLGVPTGARGIVIFAHGSGSSRFSSRNRFVAAELHRAGFATLLLDLLTSGEEEIDSRTRQLRFDIDLLAGRLMEATNWTGENPDLGRLPIGYFGASTGAAAALIAAARLTQRIHAVVSRGGRPDLAASALSSVTASVLLIVGGEDAPVIDLNRNALGQLSCEKKLEIVPGASHLFEEPGALEQVSRLAAAWFDQHLTRPA
ncbi:MAG TPA: dienelactone hydrolase family protein [Bryobacteraceae bacterium]|nr:dienelactone hydrolase family protein [Bryobacteraceae bacterium]